MKNLCPKPKTRIFTRLAAGLLCVLALVPAFSVSAAAAEYSKPDVERCSAAILYNFENDQTVYEYKSRDRAFPGSSVKLMTALVAFDAFGDNLSAQITVTGAMLAEVTGNSIDFYEGEIVTAEEMLNCMLVNSANDAAIILAHAAAGSTIAFVERMNEKAVELGLMSSVYTNVTGMHDP